MQSALLNVDGYTMPAAEHLTGPLDFEVILDVLGGLVVE